MRRDTPNGVGIGLLGPLTVSLGGQAAPPGSPKQNALIAFLVLHRGESVSRDRLIDALWGESPPATAKSALQGYVAHWRRVLEPDRSRGDPMRVLVTDGSGYMLALPDEAVDAERFESLLAAGQAELERGRAREAVTHLEAALALWRGAALPEFAYESWARAEAERLDELRLVCREERFEAELRLGRDAGLVADLEAMVAQHPLRERLRRQLMLALYRSGRQAEALESYRQTRRLLADELGLEPSNELRELEAAILRQDAELRSVSEPAAAPTSNVPAPATPLVGRAAELARATDLLRSPEVRLLTLTGPGGSGKTHLALEVAAAVEREFADGACFCELAPIADPLLALSAIARALGLRESSSEQPLEQLESALRARAMLLVLDNLEQVIDVAPALARLLASCRGLKLLATSRERLHVRAEHELGVEPLSEPDAVELFLQRARAVRRELEPQPEIAAICARLDRLPLAIELAAAHVRSSPPDEILARIEDRFTLLAGGARDLPGRQQTMRAAIEWSYRLLDAEEQRVCRALAVFVETFSRAAAESVCSAEPSTVEALLDKSLVRRGGDRYTQLETIRAFEQEELERAGESAQVIGRLAEWLVEELRTGSWAGATFGSGDPDWERRLWMEQANVAAAIEGLPPGHPLATELCALCWDAWYLRGRLREGKLLLERATVAESGDAWPLGRALFGLATISLTVGDVEGGRAAAERSLELCRRAGDGHGIVNALLALATAALVEGRLDDAAALLEEGLEQARLIGDRSGARKCTANLAAVALDRGDWHQASRYAEEAIAIAEDEGDPVGIIIPTHNLGIAKLELGELDAAAAAFERALRLSAEADFPEGVFHCLEAASTYAIRAGETRDGLSLAGSVRTLGTTLGLEEAHEDRFERAVALARSELADDADAVLAEGASRSSDEATSTALALLTRTSDRRASSAGRRRDVTRAPRPA